jgi:serine/threonine-protein kinase
MDLRPGRVLDERFVVVEPIARGGLASIHRARDLEDPGSPVVIKALHAIYAGIPEVRARLAREADLSRRLGAEVGAPLRGAGVVDERPYLAFDLLVGHTLKALGARGAWPLHRAVKVIDSLLARLDVLHRAGYVHRDVKPANVIVGPDDTAYLIDLDSTASFGARRRGVARLAPLGQGSFAYSAPEQWDERTPPDARADLYSVGMLLFELCAGRRPVAVDPAAPLDAPVHRAPPRLAAPVSSALADVVARALDPDPLRRPPSAAAMRDALAATPEAERHHHARSSP